jgi:hypothetical protein
MIYLDYLYNLPNETSGFDNILLQIASTIPPFIPLILFFVWAFVFLGGVGAQSRRMGSADYPMWSVIASISTLLVSLILSVTAGFIRLEWLAIVITITIFSSIWFFLDRKYTEI